MNNLLINQLILVDEEDRQIGIGEKLEVHKTGALHRAFSVFLFKSDQGRLQVLLQQRYCGKYHSGGLWGNSCCGHPNVGEGIIAAGQRRTNEELGIKVRLTEVDSFIYKKQFANGLFEHEFDHVLVGNYEHDEFQLHPEEVEAIQWLDVAVLDDWLQVNQQQVAVWLPLAWQVIKRNLINVTQLLGLPLSEVVC